MKRIYCITCNTGSQQSTNNVVFGAFLSAEEDDEQEDLFGVEPSQRISNEVAKSLLNFDSWQQPPTKNQQRMTRHPLIVQQPGHIANSVHDQVALQGLGYDESA